MIDLGEILTNQILYQAANQITDHIIEHVNTPLCWKIREQIVHHTLGG
jgi:hypothetical protein